MPSEDIIDVAAGIILRGDGRVLLAERPRGKPLAGCWEFPGGKFEAGESPVAALARELHEELGIELDEAHPWITRIHAYPARTVRLHMYRVPGWHGEPHGREGQRLSWEDPHRVSVSPLLSANDGILQSLNLPALYAITHASKYGTAGFLERLRTALDGGLRLIQVRERGMAPAELAGFARDVAALAHDYGARVLINGDTAMARECGADGVHLQAEQLMQGRSLPDGIRLLPATTARNCCRPRRWVRISPCSPRCCRRRATRERRPSAGSGSRNCAMTCPCRCMPSAACAPTCSRPP
jgi:8-oxo-dGTP diphosphatase